MDIFEEIAELLKPNPWKIETVMTEEELQDYADAQYAQHRCIIQETPDGMGCVTCLYG